MREFYLVHNNKNEVIEMFTGIVQGTGKVLKIVEQTTISTFTIQLPDTENLQIGPVYQSMEFV